MTVLNGVADAHGCQYRSVSELAEETATRRGMQARLEELESELEVHEAAMAGQRRQMAAMRGAQASTGADAPQELPILSADLVNNKAYMMWIDAGCPMGADFSNAAYNSLVHAFNQGRSVAPTPLTPYPPDYPLISDILAVRI